MGGTRHNQYCFHSRVLCRSSRQASDNFLRAFNDLTCFSGTSPNDDELCLVKELLASSTAFCSYFSLPEFEGICFDGGPYSAAGEAPLYIRPLCHHGL